MAYSKTNWQNGVTPINETNLNKIENQLEVLSQTSYADGSTVSINDLNTDGKWRIYIPANSNDANYLGFAGNCIVETFLQSNTTAIMQRITRMTDGKMVFRYAATPTLDYNTAPVRILEDNIITAYRDADVTKGTTGYERIVLNGSNRVGNRLSISSGNIVIGAGISKVKISAKVSFTSVTAGVKWLTIYRNNNASVANPMNLSARGMITSSDTLIDVAEGDTISLQINGTSGDVIRGGVEYTNITVEAYT